MDLTHYTDEALHLFHEVVEDKLRTLHDQRHARRGKKWLDHVVHLQDVCRPAIAAEKARREEK